MSKLTATSARLIHEREFAYHFELAVHVTDSDGVERMGTECAWVPKSQCSWDGTTLRLTQWICEKKETEIGEYLREGGEDVATVGIDVETQYEDEGEPT